MYVSTGRTKTKNYVELGNNTHILHEILELLLFLLHSCCIPLSGISFNSAQMSRPIPDLPCLLTTATIKPSACFRQVLEAIL